MQLSIDAIASPIGRLSLACDYEGNLRALDFEGYDERKRRLLRLHYGTVALVEGRAPASIIEALGAYFDGRLGALDAIAVATGGTPFQREVWRALRTIPAGQTSSYGALAVGLGRRGASRAVGLANGSNPVAIVVPCHRVVGANGTLTGFGGGLPRKRWLLDHEAHFSRVDLFAAPGDAAPFHPEGA